jgi:Tol biopolymer transport system component
VARGLELSAIRLSLLFLIAAVLPAGAVAFPGEPGPLAFVSDRDGNYEIYSQNLDGSGLVNLTNDPGPDQSPAWSADGTRLAFASFRGDDGRQAIYTMNADGSEQRRVSPEGTGLSDDATPAWSPAGDRLAFASTRPFGDSWRIWTMNADGTAAAPLSDQVAIDPAWSPDGSQIAFAGRDAESGTLAIHVVNADGSNAYRVTQSPLQETQPAWSPDGHWLAFARDDGSGGQSLFVAYAGGGTEQQVTSGSFDANPVWSPDTRWIAFQRRVDGERELFILSTALDGPAVPLDDLPGANGEPDWSVRAATPPPPPGDTTPPVISIGVPLGDRPFVLESVVNAFYVCRDGDEPRPLPLCEATVSWAGGERVVSSGEPLPTADVGLHTVTVRARDFADNEASATRTYRVVFAFAGFFAPLAPLPTFSEQKAGQEVPVRFSLDGDRGLAVLSDAPTSWPVGCDDAAASGPAERHDGVLHYNAKQDKYTFTWETRKEWANSCRQLTVSLVDGTRHSTNVSFEK